MTQLTIKTSVSKEVEKKIIIPIFWKEPTAAYDSYRAILDEKTFVEILVMYGGQSVTLRNSNPAVETSRIKEADESYNLCTESEFMQAYDDAWGAIRLKPVLIDTGSEEAYMEFMKTQNF